MSVGFRKSLFGFNSSDVMEYIENSQKNFKSRETELSNQLEEISKQLNLTEEDYKSLSNEKDSISAQLKEFTDKYDEIQRLSENIGKLYLVAQANAQAIIAASSESSSLATDEVNKNLTAIDNAHSSLDELKSDIKQASDDFVAHVDSLIQSLCKTKDKITENTACTEQHKAEFDKIYNSIVK